PTFTEQRDAILIAMGLRNPGDQALAAQAFAKRGSGSCAVSPARNAAGNIGVSENFDIKPLIQIATGTLAETGTGCDHDGYADGGEWARVVLSVLNGGGVPADATVTISTTTPGVTFMDGSTTTTISVAALNAVSSQNIPINVKVASTVTAAELLNLAIEV